MAPSQNGELSGDAAWRCNIDAVAKQYIKKPCCANLEACLCPGKKCSVVDRTRCLQAGFFWEVIPTERCEAGLVPTLRSRCSPTPVRHPMRNLHVVRQVTTSSSLFVSDCCLVGVWVLPVWNVFENRFLHAWFPSSSTEPSVRDSSPAPQSRGLSHIGLARAARTWTSGFYFCLLRVGLLSSARRSVQFGKVPPELFFCFWVFESEVR